MNSSVVGEIALQYGAQDMVIGEPRARIRELNGAPALFVGDRPIFPMMMMAPWFQHEATEQGQVKLRAEVEAGIELHSTCDELDLGEYEKFWPGPGQYRFDLLDAKLAAIHQHNPQAHVFIKWYVQAPVWWARQYPEELVRYASGYTPDHSGAILNGNFEKNGAFASYASQRWQEDVLAMLEAFLNHLLQNPMADRVIGINLLNGHGQEWHYWGSIFDLHPDISMPMTRHFQAWLRKKYQDDATRLQKAWGRPGIDFDQVEAPGLDARLHSLNGHFRDQQREMEVIDYYHCQHDLTADVLIRFCRKIKEGSQNALLAGAYYGYLFHSPWYPDGQSLGLAKVLRSPFVDFLAAPANYNDWLSRGVGGDGLPRGLPESCKAHGKLYLTESDEGTYGADRLHRPCEAMRNWDDSVANMRKQFCQVMIRNGGHWWWDWEEKHGLYLHSAHIKALRSFKEIGNISLHLDRRSNAEVAVVYNFESYYHTTHALGGPNWDLTDIVPHTTSRCGVPFDLLMLDDIDREELPAYKVFIFPQCFYVTAEMRQRIHRVLAGRRATALWVYAPGYVDNEHSSLEAMRALTGIKFKTLPAECSQEIRLVDFDHPLTRDLPVVGSIMRVELAGLGRGDENRTVVCERREDFRFGSPQAVLGPTFIVDDCSATTLGVLEANEQPGLAVKEMDGWCSIYSAAIPTSTALLRRIFQRAGVHCFHEQDDVLMINRHFFCFSNREGMGTREIHLPFATDVFDVFEKQWLASGVDALSIELRPYSTQLFYYGSREDYAWATVQSRDGQPKK